MFLMRNFLRKPKMDLVNFCQLGKKVMAVFTLFCRVIFSFLPFLGFFYFRTGFLRWCSVTTSDYAKKVFTNFFCISDRSWWKNSLKKIISLFIDFLLIFSVFTIFFTYKYIFFNFIFFHILEEPVMLYNLRLGEINPMKT